MALVDVSAIFAYRISASVVDPDIWHQMALFREALRAGALPLVDMFAYTPVVAPSVQHEWGAGAIALAIAQQFGAPGLGLSK